MSFLSDVILKALAAHVAKTLGSTSGVTETKVLAALKSFKVPAAPSAIPKKEKEDDGGEQEAEEEESAPAKTSKAAAKSKAAPAKSSAKAKSSEGDDKHKCEYMVKGDNPHVCGKGAKTEYEGMWYCGTDKSGHLSSVMKASEKAGKKPTAPAKAKTFAKATVPSKTEPKKEQLNLVTVGEYFIYPKNRIAFKKGTRTAIGILDKDNATLKPLDAEAIRFCESRNLETAANKGKPAAKTSAKPAAPSSKPSANAKPPAKVGKAPAKKAAASAAPEEEVDLGEEAPETEEVAEAAEEDVEEEQVDIQLGEEGEEEPDVEEETEAGTEEGAEEGEEGEEEGEGGDEGEADVEEGEGEDT